MDYPSAGARHLAETGRTVAESVIEDAGIPEGERAAVSLRMMEIPNTLPGYRPSDAARKAVREHQSCWGPWRRGPGQAVMRQLRP
jgi:hypothetical protein